ncbi:MAG: cell division protein SepF [Pseudanabaenaceae cyanobacterium]
MGLLEAFNKIFTSEGDDYVYEEESPESNDRHSGPEEAPARPSLRRERYAVPGETASTSSNVIGMATAMGISQIYMMEPRHFDEMSDAVRALHERKTVILNMTMMEPDQAQRSVDFVAGATHALGGDLERVGDGIFIFAPSNVQLLTPHSANEPPMPRMRTSRTMPNWDNESGARFARS